MIRGLVRKEIRDLRPFIALGAFLLLLDVAEWIRQGFNTQTLQENFATEVSMLGVVMFLLAFAVGTGLLIREVDDRTLGFLDGLPVTRTRVFGLKYLATAGVLLLYPASYMLLMLLQHLLSRGSLNHAVHPGLLMQAFAMICFVTALGLALGMMLGFLRNLCWLVMALLALALNLIKIYWPAIAVLDPVEIMQPHLVGAHWAVSGSALAVQSGVMAGCLLASLYIFLRSGGDRGRRLRTQLSRPLVSAVVTLATIGACIAAIAVIMTAYEKKEPGSIVVDKAPGTEFKVSPAGSARTQYYSFSYPAQQSSWAQDLLAGADDLYLGVAQILGNKPGARIDVDLSGSLENTEGTAFQDRIRMRPGELSRITLAHETAHTLARRLAGGEKMRELWKMMAFDEGLAEWIGNEVAGGGALTAETKFAAAVVSQRRLVKVEQVMDLEVLARVADENLKYPLGAVLVDATFKRYGRDSLSKILRAIGNPDFPRDLVGPELWHAAYQAAGFDLALVQDDYARQLKSWEIEFAERIAALPRPRGSLVTLGGLIGVELRVDRDLPEGWISLVRFRPSEDSSLLEYSISGTDGKNIAMVPPGRVANAQVCFQPGVATGKLIIFENWACLPRDSAAELEE